LINFNKFRHIIWSRNSLFPLGYHKLVEGKKIVILYMHSSQQYSPLRSTLEKFSNLEDPSIPLELFSLVKSSFHISHVKDRQHLARELSRWPPRPFCFVCYYARRLPAMLSNSFCHTLSCNSHSSHSLNLTSNARFSLVRSSSFCFSCWASTCTRIWAS